MTRVDFYVLRSHDEHSRLLTACRLIHKAFTQGLRVHVYTQDEAQTEALDRLLWSFRQDAFIPHTRDPASADEWVCLHHQQPPQHPTAVLLNLAVQRAPFAVHIPRIMHIVNEAPEIRASGREHYRFYRDQGCELNHYPLES